MSALRPSRRARFFAIPAALLALTACEGGDGAVDVRSPFTPFGPRTVVTVDGRLPTGQVAPWTAHVAETKVVEGRPYDSWHVSIDAADPRQGLRIWVDQEDEDTFTFRGFEEVSVLTVTADRPYTVRVDGPVGKRETVTIEASAATADDPTPKPGTAVVDYVKASDDETLETPMGTLSGVKHFTGTITLEGEGAPAIVRGFPVEVEVWYHPVLGAVKGTVPLFGLGMDARGQEDCGQPLEPGLNVIQKVGTVQPGGVPFELSTRDCSGTWNADKNVHAKMLLELRFADEAKAKTDAVPPVVEEFGTAWGYFPERLVSSPLSIFHPEENGKGYTFWYALVDQAAKNEPGDDGILYRITVEPADYMTSAVRATARIVYHVVAP